MDYGHAPLGMNVEEPNPTMKTLALLCILFHSTLAAATALTRPPPNLFIDLRPTPQVINGIPALGPRGEEFFKPVVLLATEVGRCTATMVGQGLLLTASHCLVGAAFKRYRRQGGYYTFGPGTVKINGRAIPYLGAISMTLKPEPHNDLALFVFGPNSAAPTDYYEISLGQVEVNTKVEVVGYSPVLDYVFDMKSTGGLAIGHKREPIKRFGHNFIVARENGALVISSELHDRRSFYFFNNPDGEYAGPASGDSGGPLISGGRVIGVTSSAASLEYLLRRKGKPLGAEDYSGMKLDHFVDLSNQYASRFLRTLKNSGLPILIAP